MKKSLPTIVKNVDKNIASILNRENEKQLAVMEKIKNYVVESGGKRVRPILLVLLSDLFDDKKSDVASSVGAVVEIIHAASLLHDDVLDNADTRRGKPSGKALFGQNEVILAGDYLLACAIEHLSHLRYPKLLDMFTKTIRDLSVSELLQLQYEKNPKITLDIYRQIIYGKTASLFESACASVAILHNLSQEQFELLSRLGSGIGNLFQMRDDYLDYFNSSLLNKPAFTDFTGGLFTFPILLFRESSAENKNTVDDFFNRSTTEREKKSTQKEFEKILQENEIARASREKIEEQFATLMDILLQFPDKPARALIEQQFKKLMVLH